MYIFVHVLFEKIWAFIASMAIEDSEVAASRPSAFVVRFSDIHNDWHAIFIIIFDKPMEGVDCVTFDSSVWALNELDSIDFRDIGTSLLLHSVPIIFND